MLSIGELKTYSSLSQKKFREKEGKFLIEGYHLIEECVNSDFIIELVIISEDASKINSSHILEKVSKKKIPIHFVKKHQFYKLSETENSQGIIAVVRKFNHHANNLNSAKLLIALDNISDPGNLGTIIRTSYWFNVDWILISSNSAELYNSKVIRSTQGALFHIKIIDKTNLDSMLSKLGSEQFKVILFDTKGETNLKDLKLSKKNILVFGNESQGISINLKNNNYERVRINGYSKCESLNVAVSCGIALNYIKMMI